MNEEVNTNQEKRKEVPIPRAPESFNASREQKVMGGFVGGVLAIFLTPLLFPPGQNGEIIILMPLYFGLGFIFGFPFTGLVLKDRNKLYYYVFILSPIFILLAIVLYSLSQVNLSILFKDIKSFF